MATRKTAETVSLEALQAQIAALSETVAQVGANIAAASAAAAPKPEKPKAKIGLAVEIHEGSQVKFGQIGVYKTYNGEPRQKLGLSVEAAKALIAMLQEAVDTLEG